MTKKELEKLKVIRFVYQVVYDEYKSVFRSRANYEMKNTRIAFYEDKLKRFQKIITDDLKMDFIFTKLKSEERN